MSVSTDSCVGEVIGSVLVVVVLTGNLQHALREIEHKNMFSYFQGSMEFAVNISNFMLKVVLSLSGFRSSWRCMLLQELCRPSPEKISDDVSDVYMVLLHTGFSSLLCLHLSCVRDYFLFTTSPQNACVCLRW